MDDRVLIRLTDVAAQTMTPSGLLHIPDTAKKYRHRLMRRGRVVAVGGKVTTVHAGDEVLFAHQDGYQVPEWPDEPHAEQELRMIREAELEGVVEDATLESGACVICGRAPVAEAAE